MRWIATIVFVLFLLTGCQSNQSTRVLSSGKFTTMTTATAAGATEAKPAVAAQTHLIVPGAVISITVERDRTFNRAYTVPNDGLIDYPPLGRAIVAGLTTKEVEDRVGRALEKNYFLKSPVTVTILSAPGTGEAVVYVIGRVNRPGPVTLSNQAQLTVSGAIHTAGALAPAADAERVQLIRYDSAGKKQVTYVNIERILDGSTPDIPVQNGDWIVVP